MSLVVACRIIFRAMVVLNPTSRQKGGQFGVEVAAEVDTGADGGRESGTVDDASEVASDSEDVGAVSGDGAMTLGIATVEVGVDEAASDG
jgi:hypothetical protein